MSAISMLWVMHATGQWMRRWHVVQCCAKRCRKISRWCQNQLKSTALLKFIIIIIIIIIMKM